MIILESILYMKTSLEITISVPSHTSHRTPSGYKKYIDIVSLSEPDLKILAENLRIIGDRYDEYILKDKDQKRKVDYYGDKKIRLSWKISTKFVTSMKEQYKWNDKKYYEKRIKDVKECKKLTLTLPKDNDIYDKYREQRWKKGEKEKKIVKLTSFFQKISYLYDRDKNMIIEIVDDNNKEN